MNTPIADPVSPVPGAQEKENVTHTPGPWAVSYVVDGAFEIVATIEGDECVIASRAEFPARHFEFLANAHLIAAAPDLLAAVKSALDWYALDGDGISEPVRSQLKAALVRAEGSPV